MKNPLAVGGANETGTILLFLIIAVWFFTSKRFIAFKKILMSKFEEVEEPNPVSDSPYISDEDKASSKGQSGVIGVTPGGSVPGLTVPSLDDSKNA